MHYQNTRSQQRTTNPFTPEIKALSAKTPKVQLNKARAQSVHLTVIYNGNVPSPFEQLHKFLQKSLSFLFCEAVTDQNKAALVCVCMEELRLGGGCSLACYDTTKNPAQFGTDLADWRDLMSIILAGCERHVIQMYWWGF